MCANITVFVQPEVKLLAGRMEPHASMPNGQPFGSRCDSTHLKECRDSDQLQTFAENVCHAETLRDHGGLETSDFHVRKDEIERTEQEEVEVMPVQPSAAGQSYLIGCELLRPCASRGTIQL